EWHRVTVWGKRAESCGKYLAKSAEVYIEGKLQTRSWVDTKSGEKKFSTDIVAHDVQFLGSKTGVKSTAQPSSDESSRQLEVSEFKYAASLDDIPF
ncbi:MAG: single-stranded DNA-binding protein, partial [Proteobacteria bacterium]